MAICFHDNGMGVVVFVGINVGNDVDVDVASVAVFVGSLTGVGDGFAQA